jgi:error-prone DNA polymerase
MINSQPLGFYAPAQLVTDARSKGIEVLPIDVNYSDWDCTLEGGGHQLRLGLRMIAGLPEATARAVARVRGSRPFASMTDFMARTKLAQSQITRLSEADAFNSLGASRRNALWHSLGQEKKPREMPLFAGVDDIADDVVALPAMPLADQVLHDYRTSGLSLKAHPLSFYRDDLHRMGVTPAAELQQAADGRPVKVAGLVLLRQRPATAKGITFVTLEDETGTVNLIVHATTWDRFYNTVRRSPAWLAEGELQLGEGVIHVVTSHIESLGEGLTRIGSVSRDFR